MPLALPIPLTFGLLCGLFVYGLGTLLWILVSLAARDLSYLYPLASVNYILIALSGHIILNEHLLPGRWVGIGIMIAGIVLITYSPPKTDGGLMQLEFRGLTPWLALGGSIVLSSLRSGFAKARSQHTEEPRPAILQSRCSRREAFRMVQTRIWGRHLPMDRSR